MDIYVARNGRRGNAGTIGDPLRNIHEAVVLARNTGGGPHTIYMRGGTYFLGSVLTLDARDNGLTIRNYASEVPVISAGQPLGPWKNDGVEFRWWAKLPRQMEMDQPWQSQQIYLGTDWLLTAVYPENYGLAIKTLTGSVEDGGETWTFWPADDVLPSSLTDAWMSQQHIWSGGMGYGTITHHSPAPSQAHVGKAPSWYTELDDTNILLRTKSVMDTVGSGGEWGIDYANHRIWAKVYEPALLDRFICPRLEHCLRVCGEKGNKADSITLQGITFAHSAWKIPLDGQTGVQAGTYTLNGDEYRAFDAPAAVEFEYASNCNMIDCVVTCAEGVGVNLCRGCDTVDLDHINVGPTGNTCVVIGARGGPMPSIDKDWDDATDAPTNCNLHDSLIHQPGQLDWGAVGVCLRFSNYCTIEYNEVYECYYTGISLGYAWVGQITSTHHNTVNNNYIHHILTAMADGAGIYCVGPQAGTELIDNFTTDMALSIGAKDTVCVAYYLDQTCEGTNWEGNRAKRIEITETGGLWWLNVADWDHNTESDNVLLDDLDPDPSFTYGPRP